MRFFTFTFTALAILVAATAYGEPNNPQLDILVTFQNDGAIALGSGIGAPYRNRKRYLMAPNARRNAQAIADEYALVAVDHWPIRSLSVYCFVYRIPAGADRDEIVQQLEADARIESVQLLQEFETGINSERPYNDTHAGLQHGLDTMGIPAAHGLSLGEGVRIAIIDSHADQDHEDLVGRVDRLQDFTSDTVTPDVRHGTAIASIIGAQVNNSRGIVGVAPEAKLEVFVSCWSDDAGDGAICDSFTLAKSLDALLEDPPHIVNMSLTGPHDPLLARLVTALHEAETIIVAAGGAGEQFPASHPSVIAVLSSEEARSARNSSGSDGRSAQVLYAPGLQIMVATPGDSYDFRSGSSLAAAHVSGVIALMLAVSPRLSLDDTVSLLQQSQPDEIMDAASINACIALQLADPARTCPLTVISSSKLKSDAENDS
jgi:subtilisin family serine protease